MKKERRQKVQKRIGLPDENDNAAASVRVIRRENVRPGVGAIRMQSREPRNQERGR